ncbi:hypothetical protein GCM10027277_02770 [Pseudoduganella ginsengisoli]|uniref:Uncharacterized protein n=1 Tax=Pseudoduganella ginsengisoli TaxID=1462440 RepID=A0A6L6Q6H6_9BURK|nr:hypothetical protein [Pseudoduganella ginsengisoli]MTW04712.1 hypothetical protein [Pseudoduganella ginsengisoli]
MGPTLLLKLFLAPALIGGVTLAGRRWGPTVAGWLSAFPIVAGPVLLTMTAEQGPAFAATAAQGTLCAVLAVLAFSVAYARVAASHGIAASMLSALAVYALAVAAIQKLQAPVYICFALVVAALMVTPYLFPDMPASKPTGKPASGGDLPYRMAAAALLVLAVSYGAAAMGPRLSGIFAMFPTMSTVLVGFSHARQGNAFAIALLRGMVPGYYAFAVFCLVLSQLLHEGAVVQAFGAAFACALAVQFATKSVMTRMQAR